MNTRYLIKSLLCLTLLGPTFQVQAQTSLARFELSLNFLKNIRNEAEAIAPGDVATFRNIILKKDARKYLFRMEGLLRLYRATEAETAKPLLRKMKELEDAVGDYVAAAEFTDYAKKISAEPAVLKILVDQQIAAMKFLDSLLTKWFMQPDPYIDTFVIGLTQLRQRSDAELLEAFRSEVRELAKAEFDLNLLDEGVHELRRQVRWLNIYAEGLSDLFYVTNAADVPNDFRQLEVSGKTDTSLKVSKSFTRKLSKFLTEIGNLKDTAEPIEAIAMAYVQAGLAHDLKQGEEKLREFMEAKGLQYPVITPAAQKAVAEFNLPMVLNDWLQLLNR